MNYNPQEDGLTHINIYSQSKSSLGRSLSNFAAMPVKLDEGVFASIEAYWYWLSAGNAPYTLQEQLRKSAGFNAKKLGRMIRDTYGATEVSDFEDKIKYAIRLKIEQNPWLKNMFIASNLPFTHYYVFKGFVKDAGFRWLVDYFEDLRIEMKE